MAPEFGCAVDGGLWARFRCCSFRRSCCFHFRSTVSCKKKSR